MKLKAGQFYGQTSKALEVGELCFTEKVYQSYSKLPSHAHELSHFCFVLAGNYNERIGSTSFERAPSALVYYPPDVSHAEEHFKNGRHFLVEIGFGGLNKVRDYGTRLDEPVSLSDEYSLNLALRMYREFTERDEFAPLALESIANELLIAASRNSMREPEGKEPAWLRQVKEFLHENYSETIGLNRLAKTVDVHPTHLARVFRRFEGCTAGEYVRKIRVQKAREKMLTSDDSLVSISLETGFSDQSHFSRSFKTIMGMTPAKYRKLFNQR